jgi:hypothetical protein
VTIKPEVMHVVLTAVDKLSEQERKFVLSYVGSGNKTKAAIESGSKHADPAKSGHIMSTRPHVVTALQIIGQAMACDAIASAAELQEWWTSIMRDERRALPARLKASEYLGKTHGILLPESVTINAGGSIIEALKDAHSGDELNTIQALELAIKQLEDKTTEGEYAQVKEDDHVAS